MCMRSKTGGISESEATGERVSSRPVRRYYKPRAEGTNFVLLDPDVAQVFRDPQSVNEVLRGLINVMGRPEQVALKKVKRR